MTGEDDLLVCAGGVLASASVFAWFGWLRPITAGLSHREHVFAGIPAFILVTFSLVLLAVGRTRHRRTWPVAVGLGAGLILLTAVALGAAACGCLSEVPSASVVPASLPCLFAGIGLIVAHRANATLLTLRR